MFSSPRSSSSRSSQPQAPGSPQYPASPHPELVASPKSIAADVFERVAARSRSGSNLNTTSSPFRRSIFPRPESSLYYTASLKSFGSVQPVEPGDTEVFGGELSSQPPVTPTRSRPIQPQPTSPLGLGRGVLSALLEASTGKKGAPIDLIQRRYTEDWVRGSQRPGNWYNDISPEEEEHGIEEEEEEDDEEVDGTNGPSRGHKQRNYSNAKTITQADIADILRKATPTPPTSDEEQQTVAESSDNDIAYAYYKTAPQSMAGTIRSDAPPVPGNRMASLLPGDPASINRPPSATPTQGDDGASTPTIPTSHLTVPVTTPKPPSRTSSRASVKWGTRNVFISLPQDIRDENGDDLVHHRPAALTTAQVLERLRMWQDMGYNIEVRDDANGHSRDIYPEERRGPVDKSEVYVNIPDRKGKSSPAT